jgi:hypothetical protein
MTPLETWILGRLPSLLGFGSRPVASFLASLAHDACAAHPDAPAAAQDMLLGGLRDSGVADDGPARQFAAEAIARASADGGGGSTGGAPANSRCVQRPVPCFLGFVLFCFCWSGDSHNWRAFHCAACCRLVMLRVNNCVLLYVHILNLCCCGCCFFGFEMFTLLVRKLTSKAVDSTWPNKQKKKKKKKKKKKHVV